MVSDSTRKTTAIFNVPVKMSYNPYKRMKISIYSNDIPITSMLWDENQKYIKKKLNKNEWIKMFIKHVSQSTTNYPTYKSELSLHDISWIRDRSSKINNVSTSLNMLLHMPIIILYITASNYMLYQVEDCTCNKLNIIDFVIWLDRERLREFSY